MQRPTRTNLPCKLLLVPWVQNMAGKTETTVPGKSFGGDFGYTCDASNASVGQAINCTVSARRFGSEGYGKAP